MYRVGYPTTLIVYIRATNTSGHPTGPNLASGTIDADTFTTDTAGAWYEIALTEYPLTANKQYAIVCDVASGGVANAVAWKGDASGPTYAGGALEYSTDSGLTWTTYTTWDLMFEVWGR